MFTLGVLMGAVGTALYYNHKQEQFLEDEADWCENLAKVQPNPNTEDNQIQPERKVLVMNKDIYKKIVTNYSNTDTTLLDEAPVRISSDGTHKLVCDSGRGAPITYHKPSPIPYVIDFEEFCEEYENHDKVTLTYYEGDDTLADETEEIIADVSETIGDEALKCFGQGSDDPDVVYVRNERLGIDYEVVRQGNKYSDLCDETNVPTNPSVEDEGS